MYAEWFNHFPFYLDWWEAVARENARPYKFAWFVEHDTFFGGRLGHFLKYYQSDRADLVDAFTSRDASSWHRNAFNWLLPAGQKRHKWEHVERMSRRLVETLRDLLDLRISAYGEVFESSVCRSLSWCTTSDLARDGFVMQPYATAYYNGNPMNRLCFDVDRNGAHSSPEHNFSGVWTHKWLCSCVKRSRRIQFR